MSTHKQRTLYTHQHTAIALIDQSLASGKLRPCLQGPTGIGKSVIAAQLVYREFLAGGKVVFTVPSISLIDQTIQMFWEENIRCIGVMQSNHPLTNPNQPVQVATLQTLNRRMLPKATLVIIDECHIVHKCLPKWMADPEWSKVPFIGLSATPWRKGLGKLFDDYLVAATTRELIDKGFLSTFKVFAPAPEALPDLRGIKIVAGDYHQQQLSDRMSKANLVADVVETWKQRAKGRPTLVFAVDRAHAAALAQQFASHGIDTEYCDMDTPREEREAIKRRMESGKREVTVNVGTLTTGCDWPFISCIVLARPTKSEMLFTQIIGRGLRKHPSKDYCLILDHSDTTKRLGFVTDMGRDFLDDGTPRTAQPREKKEREPIECSNCHAVVSPVNKACPECGHEFQRKAEVTYTPGKLEEVTQGKPRERQLVMWTREEKQSFWSQVLGYSKERDKSEAWCLAQYRTKFGEWPSKERPALLDVPIEPLPAFRNWIKSRLIAFVKAKEAQANATEKVYGRFQ